MLVFVINCGSSSLKYQIINMDNEEVIAKGICERIGLDGVLTGTASDSSKFVIKTPMPDHTAAFLAVKAAITEGEHSVISDLGEISAIGHRIVQGGDIFTQSVLVDDQVIKDIEKLAELAPLHNKAHAQGIKACTAVFGKSMPQVVVFDTSFHSTMPPEAYMFALPYKYYEKYNIRRYGFHGTSHNFVSARCAKVMNKDIKDLKIVTCHLGNGCSISAVKNGVCVDTTMGLTPLDGFMMGSRCGAVDPSAITYIMDKENISPKEMDTIMNKKSGVLGISGVSTDDRDLVAAHKQGNEKAGLARKMQHYQIRKSIGSFVAAMDGVDAIVFTGGIGENTIDMRYNVCSNLSYLGIEIDKDVNASIIRGLEGEISTPNSKVKVFVLPTNEEIMIARDTIKLANKN